MHGGEEPTPGTYGIALPDLRGEPARHLGPAPESWAPWRMDWLISDGGRLEVERLWSDRAQLRISGGGWADIDGARKVATLHVPPGTSQAALVHPYLSLVASMAAYWRGWHYLHAGAFVLDGAVWGVFGVRGAGKTSTLALLNQRDGLDVLCDDVLVIDQTRTAYAGPRCTDLREETAQRLGVGEDLGVVGGRRRWRAGLGQVAPELPFRGWVELEWAETVAVSEPAPSERFEALGSNLALRLVPPDPAALLALLDVPFLKLSRPRDFGHLDAAVDRLLEALSG